MNTCGGRGSAFLRNNIELYIFIIPFISETGVEGKRLVLPVYAHSRLEEFPNSLLEKVSFTLLTDRLHPLERVSDFVVVAATSEAEEKLVSAESDVVAHHS